MVAPHTRSASKAGAKKNSPTPVTRKKTKDHEVITLRIPKEDKALLLARCHRLSKQRGKQVSFNSAIIELIRADTN